MFGRCELINGIRRPVPITADKITRSKDTAEMADYIAIFIASNCDKLFDDEGNVMREPIKEWLDKKLN